MGFNFKSILRNTAPVLAATLGGPFGPAAAKVLGAVLGKPDAQEDEIPPLMNQAIATDPDVMLKIRTVETEFAAKMAQMGYDSVEKLESIAAEDRASARAREIAVRDKTPAILASAVTFGFFGLLVLLVFFSVPTQSQTLLNVMIGSLGAAFIAVVSYYFGSSSGSAAKTEIISKAQPVK